MGPAGVGHRAKVQRRTPYQPIKLMLLRHCDYLRRASRETTLPF